MTHELTKIDIKGIMPTNNGCAVFLGTPKKTFVIHIDPNMGLAMSLNLQHIQKERPLTHDLIANIFSSLGVRVNHVAINDIKDSTFFARIILVMENELGKKVIEIDARPSDALVIAIQGGSPIFIDKSILEKVDDVTDVFQKMLEEGQDGEGNPPLIPPSEDE